MGSVIAFANQKGGVAKTTTVHSLGDAFLERGRSVLLVDLDPQACLTYAVGIDADVLDGTLHDVVVGRANAVDVLIERGGCPAILPSSIDLAGAEVVARRINAGRAQVPLETSGGVVPVPVSIGGAAIGASSPESDFRPGALLDRADRCLYASKGAGRDRCTMDTACAEANAKSSSRGS